MEQEIVDILPGNFRLLSYWNSKNIGRYSSSFSRIWATNVNVMQAWVRLLSFFNSLRICRASLTYTWATRTRSVRATFETFFRGTSNNAASRAARNMEFFSHATTQVIFQENVCTMCRNLRSVTCRADGESTSFEGNVEFQTIIPGSPQTHRAISGIQAFFDAKFSPIRETQFAREIFKSLLIREPARG